MSNTSYDHRRHTVFMIVCFAFGLFAAAVAIFGLSTKASHTQAQSAPSSPKPETTLAWDGKSFVVHEWGTFTTVQGSDGVILDGLSHDEKDLPEFVHDLRKGRYGRNMAVRGIKMETPVVYFYAPEPRSVSLRVDFPRGVVTQFYPMPGKVNYRDYLWDANEEKYVHVDTPITELKNGFIEWGHPEYLHVSTLKVLAPTDTSTLPKVADDDPWRFSREVDANTVRVCGVKSGSEKMIRGEAEYEYEKCLFYRGLGDFPQPVTFVCSNEIATDIDVTLDLSITPVEKGTEIHGVTLVWVRGGKAAIHVLDKVDEPLSLKGMSLPLLPIAEAVQKLRRFTTLSLTASGLYPKESEAMVNTWAESWFHTEGLRALYLVPKAVIDRELPLSVKGFGAWVMTTDHKGEPCIAQDPKTLNQLTQPPTIVRTFVGRAELLSPQQEAEIERNVRLWASGEAKNVIEAKAALTRWGRLSVPYIRRVEALTTDLKVKQDTRELIKHLLHTDRGIDTTPAAQTPQKPN